jgi:hypothetical protein
MTFFAVLLGTPVRFFAAFFAAGFALERRAGFAM